MSYRKLLELLVGAWFFVGAVLGQTIITSLSDELLTLPCESINSTDGEVYQWTEIIAQSQEENIYVVGSAGIGTYPTDPKYDNFVTNVSTYPTSVPLIIDNILPADEGRYMCIAVFAGYAQSYDVLVEVSATVVIKNGLLDVESLTVTVGESYDITCQATGARSRNELILVWEPPLQGGDLVEQTNGDFTDYTITSTYTPQKEDKRIRCQLTGYALQDEIKDRVFDSTSLTVQYKPECSLTVVSTVEADCRTVTVTCECSAAPEATEYFFYNGSSLINNTVTNTIDVNVHSGTTSEFSCQASNDVGTGEQSNEENHLCEEGSFTSPTTIFITDNKIANPLKSNTGLIVACSIEAAIIVVLTMVIMFLIKRIHLGYQKENSQRFTEQVRGNYGTDNRAYMDLQELGYEKNGNMVNLQIIEQNVKMISILRGEGTLQYHKALITRIKGNQEGVVKTLSDNSTVPVIKLLRSEVQHNIKLGNGKNIVKLLGWCDTVPTYVIFEHVYGENLSNHLKDEFSRHEVHTYGNTEKKKFQVSEKGSIDILSKYALHAAKGIQFLHKNKFLHPGLRAKKILVDSTGNCKLYDFVSLKNANEWIRLFWNKSVPYQWMPPEFLFLEDISPPGDIWSFAVLLWEIFNYGSEPYIGQTRSDVEKQIRQKELLHLPENCPGAIWQLLISCWEHTAGKRPKIDEITSKLAAMFNVDKEYQEIQ